MPLMKSAAQLAALYLSKLDALSREYYAAALLKPKELTGSEYGRQHGIQVGFEEAKRLFEQALAESEQDEEFD